MLSGWLAAGNHNPGSYLVWRQQGGGAGGDLAEGSAVAPSQLCKIKEAREGPRAALAMVGGGGYRMGYGAP